MSLLLQKINKILSDILIIKNNKEYVSIKTLYNLNTQELKYKKKLTILDKISTNNFYLLPRYDELNTALLEEKNPGTINQFYTWLTIESFINILILNLFINNKKEFNEVLGYTSIANVYLYSFIQECKETTTNMRDYLGLLSKLLPRDVKEDIINEIINLLDNNYYSVFNLKFIVPTEILD